MRILFTGASSFSGFHFVTALAGVGHKVICPLRGGLAGYEGLRRARVERLQPIARLVEHTSFGAESFLQLISKAGPFDLLCHHAADVTNYKSPDFDPIRALQSNTYNLAAVLSAFKKSGGKAVVLTGTLFEPDEGLSSLEARGRIATEKLASSREVTRRSDSVPHSLPAFSPYGLSKGLTWQMFRYYCEVAGVPLGKFVLPNPFGPFEEPRFTAYLMNTWKAGQTAQVRTPDYVRDNCHISLLCLAYVAFVQRSALLTTGWTSISASGYFETQGDFTARIAREVSNRTKWKCGFELLKQQEFPEPMIRFNKEPLAPRFPDWNESTAWDDFVGFYNQGVTVR